MAARDLILCFGYCKPSAFVYIICMRTIFAIALYLFTLENALTKLKFLVLSLS